MQTTAMTLNKIRSKLAKVPDDKLSEIDDFVEFILQKSRSKGKKIVKLEGIWKGLGFEKIDNLESEIKKIRKESEELIAQRVHKWNT